MGMLVAYIHNLVFTQIGPLMCFGLLGPCSENDRWALSQSRVSTSGGSLPNLIRGEINFELTDGMLVTMDHADVHCNLRVRDFAKSRGRIPLLWSKRHTRMRLDSDPRSS